MDGCAGRIRASRHGGADEAWARPEGVRWRRLLGRLALLAVAVAGSAAFVSVPDLEPSATTPRPSPLDDRGSRVESVAFSTDGGTLLACGADGVMEFWSMAELIEGRSGAAPETITERAPRLAAAYSPDGRHFATAGIATAVLWRIERGGRREAWRLSGGTSRCLAFSADGATLALGGDDGAIRLLDVETGIEKRRLTVHSDAIRSLAFSPDGRRLVSSGQDRRVMLWDVEHGQAIRNLTTAGSCPVQYLALSPDGRTVAVGDAAGSPENMLMLLDADVGRIQARLGGHGGGIRALAFAPDGRTLATAGLDRKVMIWDLATNHVLQTLEEHVGLVESLAFSPDGARLALGGERHALLIWDLASPRLLAINRRTLARALYRLTLGDSRGKSRLPGA